MPVHSLFFKLVAIAIFHTLHGKNRCKEKQNELIIFLILQVETLYTIRENALIRMIESNARSAIVINSENVAIF